jgi:hypothetical protein
MTAARPKVQFAYFTCSPQTLRVVEAAADVLHPHRFQAEASNRG